MNNKLWSGRFKEKTNKILEEFSSSVHFDYRLFESDILGSTAYLKALAKARIISQGEKNKILIGLKGLLDDYKKGKINLSPKDEDVHLNIEKLLIKRIGNVAKKIHTGRSRNDQVVTDVKIYLKIKILDILNLLYTVEVNLIKEAKKYLGIIMPGYTHLQHAQPVLLSHYFLSYCEMFLRDLERMTETYKRVDVLPLGSGAVSGNAYRLDREYMAKELGFTKVSQNSIDAVSERDFIVEFISDCALISVHLSRLSEDFIFFMTKEAGYITLSDDFVTGSSMMPQKKNPDALELIRGKSGRIFGNLQAILTVLKGLPLSYNRDLQEDKELLFDTVETIKSCLSVINVLLPKIRVNKDRMNEMGQDKMLLATDLADYLTKNGIAFRDAHNIVGKILKEYDRNKSNSLIDVVKSHIQKINKKLVKGVEKVLSPIYSVDQRDVIGGTANRQVIKQISRIENILNVKV